MRYNVFKSELFKSQLTEITEAIGAEFRRYKQDSYWSKWANLFIIDDHIADIANPSYEKQQHDDNVFYQIGYSQFKVKHNFVLILCEVDTVLLGTIAKMTSKGVVVVYDLESLIIELRAKEKSSAVRLH